MDLLSVSTQDDRRLFYTYFLLRLSFSCRFSSLLFWSYWFFVELKLSLYQSIFLIFYQYFFRLLIYLSSQFFTSIFFFISYLYLSQSSFLKYYFYFDIISTLYSYYQHIDSYLFVNYSFIVCNYCYFYSITERTIVSRLNFLPDKSNIFS